MNRSATVFTYVASFSVLLGLWHLLSVYVYKSVLFPSPAATASAAVRMLQNGSLQENMVASLRRILTGFLLGSLVGIPIGMLMGSFRLARAVFEPWTEFLRFIPATAMITIVVIWFGIGEESKVFLVAYATSFIVILNTAAGVASVAPNKIRAARALGAQRAQIFFLVALPATLPFILTGMRLAMAQSYTAIVAAEMIAADRGLGAAIWNARMLMLVEEIFVSLVTLGVLGFVTDRLFRWAIFKFARRYAPVA